MLRKTVLLSAALFSVTACLPLSARPTVDIDLIDRDTGQTLPEYGARGQVFVPGEPGHRYSVRLSNQSAERVLVVLSVDGVNAVTGQNAHPSQAGYVLEPWESAEIAGWRKSLDDIAQFYFTDLPDSYAARTGRPNNVGVVGIAIFRERSYARPYPLPYPLPPPIAESKSRGDDEAAQAAEAASPSSSANRESAAADSAYDGMPQRRIGTGHGQREWSPVDQTSFQRASSRPAQVLQLRYEDPDTLVAMGILPRYPRYWNRSEDGPRAFPQGFVADPPSW